MSKSLAYRCDMSDDLTVQAVSSSSNAPMVSGVEGAAPSPFSVGTDPKVNSDTLISSFEELRTKAPKVYEETLKSIQSSVLSQMKRFRDRIHELNKEMYRDDN